MWISNSLGNFQEKTNEMFQGFEIILKYIDNLLIVVNCDFSNHL